MLNEYINSCNIYDKSFFDDLKKYKLIEDNNNLYISYNHSIIEENTTDIISLPNNNIVSFKIDSLNRILRSNYDYNVKNFNLYDTWLPIFVNTNNSFVDNKLLSRGLSIERERLGIENFLSFIPQFNNWTLDNDTKISTDWIITPSLVPFNVHYGLLYWVKFASSNDITNLNGNVYREISQFPDGSRLLSNDPLFNNSHFIKLDNTYVKQINFDGSKFDNDIIAFNLDIDKKLVSSFNNDSGGLFKMVRPNSNKFSNNTELWVSDGDFYCYSNDEEQSYNSSSSLRSYISPALYNSYIQIYHNLTLYNLKGSKYTSKSLLVSRRLKKLCYCLASGPLFDHITQELLTSVEIRNIVNNYLASAKDEDINAEQKNLQSTVQTIFSTLKLFNFTINKKTISDNYIVSKSDLFRKLINKYRCYLNMTGETKLSYKHKLTHGNNLFFIQNIESYCDKKIAPNTVVFNNQSIQLNNMSIETDIDDKKSNINLIGDDIKTILPLSDNIKSFPRENNTFTIGKDQIIFNVSNNSEKIIEIEGISDPDFDSSINYLWESIGGRCLRFEDFGRDPYRQKRFLTSFDGAPRIYIYGPGTYRIKATVTTDAGSAVSTKTIYATSLSEDDYKKLDPPPFIVSGPVINPVNNSKLKIICPNFNQIAVGRCGIFWPIKTDVYVGKLNGLFGEQFNRLEGQVRYPFRIKNPVKQNSDLLITYKPNNTFIKLEKIILNNTRNETEECSQCLSLHRELLYTIKNPITRVETYIRGQRKDDFISLPRYDPPQQPYSLSSKPIPVEISNLIYPDVTTETGPRIKSYGGYDLLPTVRNIGVAIPYSPPLQQELPIVTGYNIDLKNNENKQVACFHYPYNQTNNFLSNSISATKTVFHPNSGLILGNNSFTNYSSVLKFNPGGRDTFVFKGVGFHNMDATIDNINSIISPKIYKSSITLNIDPSIVPDPPPENATLEDTLRTNDANQRKELGDLDVNYGYRVLNRGYPVGIEPISDEFGVQSSLDDKTNPNCGGPTTTYSFVSLGPKKYQLQPTPPALGKLTLQDIRVPYFSIKDVEVKLNFLNYVNTKNLVIWLDMNMCAADAKRTNKDQCQLQSDNLYANISPDSNCISLNELDKQYSPELSLYLKELASGNYVPDNKTIVRLYLLNQEHIQNNTYNFSLKFSDSASKFNKLYQHNVAGNIPITQNIVNNNGIIQPTSAKDYSSDANNIYYRNIIDYNNVFLKHNSFAKYRNFSLFKGDGDPQKEDSSITFSLNIAVIDETDNMTILDNTTNSDLISGFKKTSNTLQSDNIYNSLCSWELILHVGEEKEFQNPGSLALIDYSRDPSYPGYSYYFDISGREHLLPSSVYNAPYSCINNTKICRFSDPDYLENLIFKNVEFPWQALLAIIVATTGFAAITGSSIGLMFFNPWPAYQLLFQYFSDKTKSETIEQIGRLVDKSLYFNYPFGNGDKILISASKNGLIWYKMEASIFRYENSLVLNNQTYKYIGLNRKSMPALSTFPFVVVSSNSQLVSDNLIYNMDQYNKFMTNIDTKIQEMKIIIVDSKIPYEIFDIEDTLYCAIKDNPSESLEKSVMIKNKMLLCKNNKLYSVFELNDTPILNDGSTGNIFYSKQLALIFNSEKTIGENHPINKWGLEKKQLIIKQPEIIDSTYGAGTYGQGSAYVRKNYLSHVIEDNKLEPIYSKLNNTKNHIRKNISATLYTSNIDIPGILNGAKGYSYSFREIQDQIVGSFKNLTSVSDDTLDKLKNIDYNEHSFMYIKSSALEPYNNTYGIMVIHSDYVQKDLVSPLSDADKQRIIDRINLLKTSNTNIISTIGIPTETYNIVNNGSIKDLQSHYDSLLPDSEKCYSSPLPSDCYKTITKETIAKRYRELNSLSDAISYQQTLNLQNVLPLYKSVLVQGSDQNSTIKNNTNTLNVNYEPVNRNIYWLNIDPKQQCNIDESLTIKVLTKTVYECQSVLGDTFRTNSVVCPLDLPTNTNNDKDIEFTKNGNTFTYTVPSKEIEIFKESYPAIKTWKPYIITKQFLIPIGVGPLRDTLVKVTETYDIAADPDYSDQIKDYSIIKDRVYSSFNLDDTENLQIKIRNIPRKLKGVDNRYDKHITNEDGDMIKVNIPSDGGKVFNDLYFWKCIDEKGKFTEDIPDQLKLQNEMIYRSFFGSSDGIEHKVELMESLYPWEWIPYEYDDNNK